MIQDCSFGKRKEKTVEQKGDCGLRNDSMVPVRSISLENLVDVWGGRRHDPFLRSEEIQWRYYQALIHTHERWLMPRAKTRFSN